MDQHTGKETKQLNGLLIHREMQKEFNRDMLPSIPNMMIVDAGGQ